MDKQLNELRQRWKTSNLEDNPMENNEISADEIKYEPVKRMRVVYRGTKSSNYNDSHGETIELSMEIDNLHLYDGTLELLRCMVLEKLNLKEQYEELKQEYNKTSKKYVELVKQLESATKQWELVSNFLKAQGLKNDTAEFPSEALTNLSKSLPTTVSGYPE